MSRRMVTIDGNTAVTHVAHPLNEVIAIYPITPSSSMGEMADAKSAAGEKNLWGTVPTVVEMQSEGGAAGAVHGALATGALTTTFTASQGLLLMIPNMFKIAGELMPTVFHVSARTVATHALSIFGDHSDVMSVRQTGFAMLSSGSVQEVMDSALIAHAATLEARVPFVHFFEGFRISHVVEKVEELTREDMRAMINDEFVTAHRERALTPDRPKIMGTAQNPDVFFQGREACSKYYDAVPGIVQKCMDRFAQIVGRQYHLFDYVGHPEAERVIIIMGSGAKSAETACNYLHKTKGEKVGVLTVRLFRPFSVDTFINSLPKSAYKIAVLDRTKEPGSIGEPLYTDVRTAIGEAMSGGSSHFDRYPLIVGGRYGLSSKDFTPAMAIGVFDNLNADTPKNHFTIGIEDDVTGSSIPYDSTLDIEGDVYRAMFYGLGSDGTVGANKNSIKIIGDATDNYAQGYFVYDSKKAGGVTVSHLRFGKEEIRSPYLITSADFVACHNFSFVEKYNMLEHAKDGAVFLLNSPYDKDTVWDHLPNEVQRQIIDKGLKFYNINAIKLGQEIGLGPRINMIMQTAFFKISNILPEDQAIEEIKKAIKKTYGKKGEKIVEMNYKAVDAALEHLEEVTYPKEATSKINKPPVVPSAAPKFVKELTAEIIAGRGESVPVSKMPVDGSFPSGTSQWEKRNIATQIPVWEPDVCIQCAVCSLVCPHATIRMKIYDPAELENAPATFKSADAKTKTFAGLKCTVQVAPEDCTGCGACVHACPAKEKDADGNLTGRKAINMASQFELRETEAENYAFFLDLPETDTTKVNPASVKGSQLVKPLFEYSGACAGCGETPYVKLLTQLFGDRAVIANATGCSSIYGGNLPTTPYTIRNDGRGPAWSNSLFEDNAEFGLGFRLTIDKFNEFAHELLDADEVKTTLADKQTLIDEIKNADQSTQEGIEAQRERVAALKDALASSDAAPCRQLVQMADYLVKKSVWILGGDGWAYDIGYGGLDHVLASGKNVNILVLDTQVYSNTGGQMSKATPIGAVAKFAAAGKPMPKKDLGMISITYGNIYVASVAMGANTNQVVRAFVEAEAYDGPSIIIAYAHCIAHGINMTTGLDEQKKAVECGAWPLYRFNPALLAEGKNPLKFESKPPSIDFSEYAYGENRFRSLKQIDPERAEMLLNHAREDFARKFRMYENLAAIKYDNDK
ncbi:MAG: pyruvate:ferredoxin (flavodoxin) oxidoreductase [Candidatus Hydrogenedentes bacterium]|nr:pyruvate:ferredoxin (flavodoxin) oxidoreductase [Candidatus Hydrogenedentota bacterium]